MVTLNRRQVQTVALDTPQCFRIIIIIISLYMQIYICGFFNNVFIFKEQLILVVNKELKCYRLEL